MGSYEHFPYSNYQDLNLDWVLQAVKDVQKKIDDFDADLQDMVDAWLEAHPEATTTVQDGSLTSPKFADSLKLEAIKDYLTPEMFGAVGDGTTDDSVALQAALNNAQSQMKPVALISNYYCNSNLTVPSYVRVFGLSQNTERRPFIFAGPSVTTLFDVPGIINRFDSFGVANSGWAYRSNILFDFHGNSSNDIDSVMTNVMMGYASKAVICRGRNLELSDCMFSHCAYGVFYDLPSAQMRGLTVKNCAFHGIGEESALNWFENSACIFIESDYNTNLMVTGCHAEQSGTFFKGRVTQGLFADNFVESYKADIVEITASPTLILGNTGCMLFVGNSFNGKAGQVAAGVNVAYPEHAVTVTDNGRIVFLANVFRMLGEEAVVLSGVTRCAFVDNIFLAPGLTDSSKIYGFKISTAYYTVLRENVAVDSNVTLYSTSTTGSLFVGDNPGFQMPATSSGVAYQDIRTLYPIGNLAAGSAITFTVPNKMYVSRDGTNRLFTIEKSGGQYTTGYCQIDANTWEVLYIASEGSDLIPYLKHYSLSGGSVSVVNMASGLSFYRVVE